MVQRDYGIDPTVEKGRYYEFGSMGNSQQAKAVYEQIFTSLNKNIRGLKQEYAEELAENKMTIAGGEDLDQSEYSFIHGLYWYVEDFLSQM